MSDKKYFIYTRKSTDTEDKQVRSLADQLAELRELARKEQLEVVDVFIEKQTAKIPGRPIFAEMLERIEKPEKLPASSHGTRTGSLATLLMVER
jgi:site-specific DNA recombinase